MPCSVRFSGLGPTRSSAHLCGAKNVPLSAHPSTSVSLAADDCQNHGFTRMHYTGANVTLARWCALRTCGWSILGQVVEGPHAHKTRAGSVSKTISTPFGERPVTLPVHRAACCRDSVHRNRRPGIAWYCWQPQTCKPAGPDTYPSS